MNTDLSSNNCANGDNVKIGGGQNRDREKQNSSHLRQYGTKLKLYFDVLKQTHFGLSLSKVALWNCAKHLFMKKTANLLPSRLAPFLLMLHITRRCQLRCSFCVLGNPPANINYEEYELTLPVLEQMLNHPMIKKILAIQFVGGEPTLNKQLPEMIQMVRRSGKIVGIVSNGLALKDCYTNLLKSGLNDVQVSVYATTYDKLQGILPEINKIRPVRTSYVLTRTTMENNPEEIERMIELCYTSGCNSLMVHLCQPGGEETIYQDHSHYFELVKSLKAKYKQFSLFFPEPPNRQLQSYKEKRNCNNPFQVIIVNGKGELATCCALQSEFGRIGNLFDSLEKSINSPFALELRQTLLSKDNKLMDMCCGCPRLGNSFGGNILSITK
jgi:MoaA/NifB/PqqE/SkfB family radical SAM enzyme